MLRQFRTAMAQAMNVAMPSYASVVNNSPNHVQIIDGFRAKKSWTVSGVGVGVIDDVFVLTGQVYVKRLGFYVTEATDSTVFGAVGFHLFDQVDTRVLDDAGLNCAGVVVGAEVAKATTMGGSLVLLNPVADLFSEAVIGAMPYHGFRATKQDGAVTELRMISTRDGATDVDVTMFCDYIPISDDGAVAAA